jgi:hypothetical protein
MKNIFRLFIFIIVFCCEIASGQIITTIAGNGTCGYSGDGGPATMANINSCWDLLADGSGNIYLLSLSDNNLRRIDPSGIINTFAGTGIAGFSGDGGPATAAQFNTPAGMAMDASGNIYIADCSNYRIRKIDAAGIITTIAGDGFPGHTGDGGPALSARITPGGAVSVGPDGTVYFVTENSVRSIDPAGIIHTVAGYVTSGYSGDGGPATAARFNIIQGMDVDTAGNIYIADRFNHRIRRVSAATGIITTICGNTGTTTMGDGGPASAASLNLVHCISCDRAGNIYLACDDSRIRVINAAGIINTFAGTGTPGFAGDGGPATAALLAGPFSITTDCKGTVYYGETVATYCRIRAITVPQYAPVYAEGSVANIRMCMSTTKNIDTLLTLSDGNSGQQLNWIVLLPAAHGTATAAGTVTTTGGTLMPAGFSYTPVIGYSGTDSFTVAATDCGNLSDTITVRVLVDSIAFAGAVSGADTLCAGNTALYAATRAGGTWSSSNTAVATAGISGVVTAVAPGTALISYRITNTCGTHAVQHPVVIVPAAACAVGMPPIAATDAGFSILPNPGTGTFTLQLPAATPSAVVVTDVTGRTIKQLSASGSMILELSVPGGLYFISVTTPYSTHTARIVVER